MKNLKLAFFSALLLLGNLTISADDIIEHRGDRYVIHVEALNPDSEMTLLDVLHLCPELISYDGKNITNDYRLRTNNTHLSVDWETALENIKASELKYVQICNYTSAAKGVNGGGGVIDIYYKPQEGTSGKVAIEGSTYGNGKLYADITSKVSPNLTLTGYAMTNQQYTKGHPTDGGIFKSRSTSEAAHLLIDWNISKNDNLKIKLYQQFIDYKHKITDITNTTSASPTISRYGDMVITYERTVNDNGALWIVEGGADYSSTSSDINDVFGKNTNALRESAPYFFTEINYPVLNNDLWIMFGWEIDYDNIWYRGVSREQIMLNNIYLQFDYSHGPWVFTLGDRFRHMNYWNRLAIPNDNDLWAHNRNNHGFVASAGYKTNGHFIQAAFDRDHYLPFAEDFFGEEVNGKRTYNTAYKTNLVWRAEARYTYQNKNFVFFGNVLHTWMNDMPTPNEQTTAVRLSATWNKGPLRLTAGANYYHTHINATVTEGGRYDNYYTLKLAPTLLLGKGFRVSSVLLYSSRQKWYDSSRQKWYDIHPHLYSSVKVNKDFGRHINVFADFHDLAGMPTMRAAEMADTYNKRALTVGMTYRFGGKK